MAENILARLTTAGRELLAASTASATGYAFTSVGFGTENYDPDPAATELRDEKARVEVASVKPLGEENLIVSISALLDGEGDDYPIGEIGVYARLGEVSEVLFAVASSSDEVISQKISGESFVLAFNLILDDVSAENLVVNEAPLNLDLSIVEDMAAMAREMTATRRQMLALRADFESGRRS